MFAFTSIAGKIDSFIDDGKGPYVFRLSEQNHHIIGSLLPPEGKSPRFAQLYMYDSENVVANRMAAFSTIDGSRNLDSKIVEKLVRVFDTNNEIVKMFRLRLLECRASDGRLNNMPNADEVAGLIPGSDLSNPRDIIVDDRAVGLKRISTLHPSFMAMQYPVLFPYELFIQLNTSSKDSTCAYLDMAFSTRQMSYSS
ncbi:hypothetical protein RJ639_018901 [Escallonia herrerae]|uniref:Helitron helicase-like domain-containing protein n=1 Tax=Escallonia herrerae TaxID=1293975 RepID=A0AA88V7N2_9ASTE|nr:hypothetical protein RJ639_018901 [Escallonia herrerae]